MRWNKIKLEFLNKNTKLQSERCLFSTFLEVIIVNAKALFVSLIVLPKVSGELIFGHGLHDPYLACLEAVLGQLEASQL